MIKNFLIILVSGVLFSCNASTQPKYKVVSIDSVPNLKHYIIKVEEGKKQFTIVSAYSLPAENIATPISPGIQLNITLKEVDKKNNPFTPLVESNRRGTEVIYIDGKPFYNPKEPLYYSDCIKGLQYLTNCK